MPTADEALIAFGPVPSRRLGRSLGINNVLAKHCSYACTYCQLGRTTAMHIDRREFYGPASIAHSVREKVGRARQAGERIDRLTFVADGEPTLDADLDGEIAALRPLGIPVAIITNSSLLWREDVRAAVSKADWVSLKVDTVDEPTWHKLNRPHGHLHLEAILAGVLEFRRRFAGTVVSETMLVAGVNDSESRLRELAEFLARLSPATAYLTVPIRPPAEAWVRAPAPEVLGRASRLLGEQLDRVEILARAEGDEFATTGDVEADLLSITAVHPMREESVHAFLARAAAEPGVLQRMVARGLLTRTTYEGNTYYVRADGT